MLMAWVMEGARDLDQRLRDLSLVEVANREEWDARQESHSADVLAAPSRHIETSTKRQSAAQDAIVRLESILRTGRQIHSRTKGRQRLTRQLVSSSITSRQSLQTSCAETRF